MHDVHLTYVYMRSCECSTIDVLFNKWYNNTSISMRISIIYASMIII